MTDVALWCCAVGWFPALCALAWTVALVAACNPSEDP